MIVPSVSNLLRGSCLHPATCLFESPCQFDGNASFPAHCTGLGFDGPVTNRVPGVLYGFRILEPRDSEIWRGRPGTQPRFGPGGHMA